MGNAKDRLAAALSDRYTIERELGAGGMATVYLATDVKHNRKVAVKVLRPELAAAVGAARFLQEITVMANLQHPNILPLHDSGEIPRSDSSGSLLYYVMPYLEGESLRDKLTREKQLAIDEAVQIAKGVASALDYAHRQGVIHRDIKPENILLHDGQPMVADFGVALAVSGTGGPRLTETGLSVGTPHYMSPEQASGDRDLDGRSDVYALGAVLYEMLSGEPPHPGATAQAVVARILSEQPTPLRKIRNTIPEGLDTAVTRALAKTPADRFPTPAEFAAAVVGGGHPTASPVGAGARKPGRLAMVAAIGVVLVAATVMLARRALTPTIQSIAVLPLENVSGDTTQDYLVQGMHNALINELSQLSAFERVSGRRSVMRFQDSRQSFSEIAEILNVDALVDASVLFVGNEVRIDVQLVQATPERDLWAESFEDNLEDVLALQRRVTTNIARQIALTLTPGEVAHLAEARSVNPQAYDYYMRGRFYWNERTEPGFRRAVEAFTKAIELDSTYAEAYAGLSDAYSLLVQYTHVPLREGLTLARETAERAVMLDTMLADAHTSLAEVHFLEREWDDAERAYRKAIELNPGYATAHHFFGWFLSYIGRHEEAIAMLERARELDPLAAIIRADLANVYRIARRFDEARDQLRRALEDQPDFTRALATQLALELSEGNIEQAIAVSERLPKNFAHRLWPAITAAAARQEAEALALVRAEVAALGGVEQVGPYAASAIAAVYVALGHHDTAITWLDHAVAGGLSAGAFSLKVSPRYDPLRSDPRFQALIERMGFPD